MLIEHFAKSDPPTPTETYHHQIKVESSQLMNND